MEEIFVTKIHINKVRHLEGLTIPLSETKRKHLILTGKNGSGKTSVLEGLRDVIDYCANESKGVGEMYEAFLRSEATVQVAEMKKEIQNEEQKFKIFQKAVDTFFPRFSKIITFLSEQVQTRRKGIPDNFLVAYFPARRLAPHMVQPKSIEKIEKKDIRNSKIEFNKYFIQHLLNLKVDRSFAHEENDLTMVDRIDNWFDNFEKELQNIFSDSELRLKFIRKPYDFFVLQKNRELATLNDLSDGYASILDIVSELIMRMENKASQVYDLQGIVLIDEIETHLHIDLQKKILPFLTSFFPKIQFIVTTHSPFVLSSVDNAVIYDLEKKIMGIEDLSDYKYDEIVETYFETNQYSDFVETQLSKYETLIAKKELSEQEEEDLYELRKYFRKLPFFLSPELQLKIQSLELYPETIHA